MGWSIPNFAKVAHRLRNGNWHVLSSSQKGCKPRIWSSLAIVSPFDRLWSWGKIQSYNAGLLATYPDRRKFASRELAKAFPRLYSTSTHRVQNKCSSGNGMPLHGCDDALDSLPV